VPDARTPTTHVHKPPSAGLDGFAVNEEFCLRLAEGVGLPIARAEVMRFGAEIAIVVERYDRILPPGLWIAGYDCYKSHREDR